jgi:hypothetical protein
MDPKTQCLNAKFPKFSRVPPQQKGDPPHLPQPCTWALQAPDSAVPNLEPPGKILQTSLLYINDLIGFCNAGDMGEILVYVDDILLIAKSRHNLQDLFESWPG